MADNSTPTNTPIARLWVTTTTATTTIITMFDDNGSLGMLRIESHEKVPIETMIITAASAAIGIWATQSDKKTTIASSTMPAVSVDNRVRPPDFTLMTVWPIMPQPAIPPMKPVQILEIPWPRHSRFLLLPVSVRSSTIVAVIMDSIRP